MSGGRRVLLNSGGGGGGGGGGRWSEDMAVRLRAGVRGNQMTLSSTCLLSQTRYPLLLLGIKGRGVHYRDPSADPESRVSGG